jgi:hypothetical protein
MLRAFFGTQTIPDGTSLTVSIKIVVCLALILVGFKSEHAQVLIKNPDLSTDSLSEREVIERQYKEFDGKFWFGKWFVERGKTGRERVKDKINTVLAMEEFDDKLWFFYIGEGGIKTGHVNKASTELEVVGEKLKASNSARAFGFDNKLWMLSGDGDLYVLVERKSFQRVAKLSLEDRGLPDSYPFHIQEFAGKLWIANKDGLSYLQKGDDLRPKSINVPGEITGIAVFANTALLVGSTKGVFYLLQENTEVNRIQDIAEDFCKIYNFGGKIWIRVSESQDGFTTIPLPSVTLGSRVGINNKAKQYVLEPVSWRRGSSLKNVAIGNKNCYLLPVEDIKETVGKKVVKVREFKDELFVIFEDHSLYRLSDHGDDPPDLDDHGDYVWYKVATRGTTYGINTIGKQFYVSSFDGIVIYSGSTFGQKTYVKRSKLSGKFIVSDVFGSEKDLWFFARDLGASSDQLYHLDTDAKLDADLLSSDSYLRTLVNRILPGNHLIAGDTNVVVKVVNSKKEAIYDLDAVQGLRASYKNYGLLQPDDDSRNCDYGVSQVNFLTPKLGSGKQKFCFIIQDAWENVHLRKKEYWVIPNFFSMITLIPVILVLGALLILFLAPYNRFCHDLVMNPLLRKYGSFGLLPLLLTVFPSVRQHVLKRYSNELKQEPAFNRYFIYPSKEFHPQAFGKKLETAKRVLLLGQSGIGKTSYFKHLAHHFANRKESTSPEKVVPIFVSLSSYQNGVTLESLIHDQLQNFGRMSDKELNEWFLRQGGFLILFDGVNEIPDASLRANLGQFVERNWRANYLCLSSQQHYPELNGLTEIKIKSFSRERINKYLREKLGTRMAEEVISEFNEKTYQLYQIPRDLDFAVDIKQREQVSPLPQTRDELYEKTLSPIVSEWEANGRTDYASLLYQRAYEMLIHREIYFTDTARSLPDDLINALSDEKYRFLVKLGGKCVFQHDLIRAYLASKHFSLRWKRLLRSADVEVDYNWLEMLKFSILSLRDPTEIQSLMEDVLARGQTTSIVGELFNWLKTQETELDKEWESDFKLKFATKKLEEISG